MSTVRDLNLRVGWTIRRARQVRNLTQKSLARRCRMSQASISLIERGSRTNNLNTLKRVSEKLGFTMGELFELADSIKTESLRQILARQAEEAARDAGRRGWVSLKEVDRRLDGKSKS
jgi:transcriptional regulator with XRE-family HTH domain